VKTDSSSKTELIVRTKCVFCCHLKETYVKTKRKTSVMQNTMKKLDLSL